MLPLTLRRVPTLARALSSPVRRHAHSAAVERLLEKKDDDVVITFAKRTAMGRYKKGQYANVTIDELLYATFKATLEATGLPPSSIDDIVVGTCHPPSPLYVSRAAALAAGIPETVPIQTVNRLCSSGLMAIRTVANSIKAGEAEVGLALGAESMSQNPRPTPEISETVGRNAQAHDCIEPMGWTSEMVAQHYHISRATQDTYALRSHQRAEKALQAGIFAEEIMPILVGDHFAREDDMIRLGVTAESLAKLRPAFPGWGGEHSTAGNSSGIGDGVAVCVLMKREKAVKTGARIIGKWVGCSVAGVEPRYMGVGPIAAIPKVLALHGLEKEDIDIWEINEAFASQFAYCMDTLGLDGDRVNVHGGAIALTHPLGMTGVRLAVTGLHELQRRNGDLLCTSMCVGSGMGAAALFVNEAKH
ncbi:thiolase [Dacryopinax primogenitus]|uniref:Thiolase n=1 Tax=Dacryopinax primogenitus (strain DJM 731) TaxID=1858805 RepID=M5GGD7_DACPD|nr:thiolase [Dacryopinax primogenitus]EJU05308.1 thiolase [Dacryopinax primogenitus]